MVEPPRIIGPMSDDSTQQPVGFRAGRVLVCLLFFTFAMTSDAVGSVVSRVISELHLSLTAAGAFQYVPMAAMAAGAVTLGYLADRLGRRPAVIAGLALYGGSSLLFALGHSFGFFVGLLALSGLGISLFKTGALALIGDLSASAASHTRLMNAAEGFFGIGSIVGPAIVALLLAAGLSWKWLYVIAAGICGGLVVLAARMPFPQVNAPATDSAGGVHKPDAGSTLRVLKDPIALGFAGLMMLYVAVECAVYVWMPTYVRSYRGTASWLPLYGLTIFFMLRAVGRFLGIWLLRHLRWTAVLAACSVFILVCFVGSVAGGVRLGAWLLPASGLAMSVVYPTLNSKGISCFPKSEHGAAAGVLLFFTAAAAALGPLAMGAVSDAYGDVRFGFILATALALLMSIALLLNWLLDPARRRLDAAAVA
jgi:MFS transporter, DHA1 family, quinolone resistance protein